jgi:hypothetical protein
MTKTNEFAKQMAVCAKYGANFLEARSDQKVGIDPNVRTGLLPINGVRQAPEGDTTGWYIWAGEKLPDDPDFFKPLHVAHLQEWCPEVIKFLGLSPGWRFLVAGDHEDVWFDANVLNMD